MSKNSKKDVKTPSKRVLKDLAAFSRVEEMRRDKKRLKDVQDFIKENHTLGSFSNIKIYLKHCKGVKIVCKS